MLLALKWHKERQEKKTLLRWSWPLCNSESWLCYFCVVYLPWWHNLCQCLYSKACTKFIVESSLQYSESTSEALLWSYTISHFSKRLTYIIKCHNNWRPTGTDFLAYFKCNYTAASQGMQIMSSHTPLA